MDAPSALADWPPEVQIAVRRNAEFQATLLADCLGTLGQQLRSAGHLQGCSGLPWAFLLELGAVAQLNYWEAQGLRDLLPVDVPTAAEATTELCRRVTNEPRQFWGAGESRLSRQLMQAWLQHFHWLEPDALDADILVSEADEDGLIEVLAQLLWQFRHTEERDNPLEQAVGKDR